MLEPTFWSDPDFQDIEDGDWLYIYLYLISNKENNSIGVYRISKRQIAFETRKDIKAIERALKGLSDTITPPKIMFDDKTGWLWVRGSFARNYKVIPHTNLRTHVCKLIKGLRVSDFTFMSEFELKYANLIKSFESPNDNSNGNDNSDNTDIYNNEFIEFWKEYPKKVGKLKAFESWQKHKCKNNLSIILNAITEQSKTEQWCRDSGLYIPHPATWLNQRRWEDESNKPLTPKVKGMSLQGRQREEWHKVLNQVMNDYMVALDKEGFKRVLWDKYKDVPKLDGRHVVDEIRKQMKELDEVSRKQKG